MSFLTASNFRRLLTALRHEPIAQVATNVYRKLINRSYVYVTSIDDGDKELGTLTIDSASIRYKEAVFVTGIIDLHSNDPLTYSIDSENSRLYTGLAENGYHRIHAILHAPEVNIKYYIRFDGIDQQYPIRFKKLKNLHNLLPSLSVVERTYVLRSSNPEHFENLINEKLQFYSATATPEPIKESAELKNAPVTIIIPTKDKLHLLKNCISSIALRTTQPHKIIVINNQSEKIETQQYFDNIKDQDKISIVNYPFPFNYAAMHNAVMSQVDTEFICFLNNDIEIKSDQWLSKMISNFAQDNVGAVGCRLFFPDGSIQHDGIYFNLAFRASYVDHINLKLRSSDPLFYHMPDRSYVTGVTGACLLTKKSTFVALDGFDADQFPIAFNDVDYCLKILKADKLIVHHTDIHQTHHESITRQAVGDQGVSQGERESFRLLMRKWRPFLTTLKRYPKNDLPKEILESWRPDR